MIGTIDFGGASLLAALTPEDRAELAARARRVRYRAGQPIHERGDPTSNMCMVIEGAVQLLRRRRDGQIVTDAKIISGQHYGDISAIDHAARTHEAVALCDTVIDHLDPQAFDQLITTQPRIVLALYRITARRLTVAVGLFDDARRLPPVARVASAILGALDAQGGSGEVPGRQEDIANLLGLSLVTVCKAVNTLAKAGLVEPGYRRISVKNPKDLENFVQSHHE